MPTGGHRRARRPGRAWGCASPLPRCGAPARPGSDRTGSGDVMQREAVLVPQARAASRSRRRRPRCDSSARRTRGSPAAARCRPRPSSSARPWPLSASTRRPSRALRTGPACPARLAPEQDRARREGVGSRRRASDHAAHGGGIDMQETGDLDRGHEGARGARRTHHAGQGSGWRPRQDGSFRADSECPLRAHNGAIRAGPGPSGRPHPP